MQSTANSNINFTTNSTLSINTINSVVEGFANVSISISSNTSFVMVQPVNQSASVTVVGASFERGRGGALVNTGNRDNVTTSRITAAAVISNQSLTGIVSLSMFIIDKPTIYENVDNSTDNRTLASAVIVAAIQRSRSTSAPVNISLYFTVLPEYQTNRSVIYLCVFYDTVNSIWNNTGCTSPMWNSVFSRYECSCNHFTAFALVASDQSNTTTSTEITTVTPSATSAEITTVTAAATSAEITTVTPAATSTTTASPTVYTPDACNSTLLVALSNGTCVSNIVGQV